MASLLSSVTFASSPSQEAVVEFFGRSPEPFVRLPPTPGAQLEIQRQVEANIDRLLLEGRYVINSEASVSFNWPLRLKPGVEYHGYYVTGGYVDHGSPRSELDFLCGERTYDGHNGTDIGLWPFPWLRMENDEVEMVAAAGGTIVFKLDGSFDRNCGSSPEPGNTVHVAHADGSISHYSHMKAGSLTAKSVGATVATGEYLGVVGSSGSSSGPHIHFEVRDAGGDLIDPFAGPCNNLNLNSRWASQPPYFDTGINHMGTGTEIAEHHGDNCPQLEEPNEKLTFQTGDMIYTMVYFRNELDTSTTQFTITRPNGSIYKQWTHISPVPFLTQSWWIGVHDNFAAGESGRFGKWQWTAEYQSKLYRHDFYVLPSCPASQTIASHTVTQAEIFGAGTTLSTGPVFSVAAGGSVTLLAGGSVALGNGSSVATGGSLSVRTEPTICPDSF